ELALKRLRHLLMDIDDVEVSGYSISIEESVRRIVKLKPDLVFLDVELKGNTGFDFLNAIHTKGYYPDIIFVTAHLHYTIQAIRAKAIDYLMKPIDQIELIEAIERYKVMRMGTDLNRRINMSADLNQSEKKILYLLAEGKTSKEIAEIIHLAPNTVDTYRRRMLKRFGVHTSRELLYVLKS
ncbi:MAG: response regulator transcription factor, partial [Bacteroidetes bacterium]|nr:response regulator transcription factor [Bacteroidota bacterium]